MEKGELSKIHNNVGMLCNNNITSKIYKAKTKKIQLTPP